MTPADPVGGWATDAAVQAWTAAMLGLWQAGLWVLRLVLGMVDALVVPDLSVDGPTRAVYGVAFWLAGTLVGVLLLVQLGVAVLRRDGAALGAALTGAAKFLIVWAAWLGYAVALVAACGGLTRALLRSLLKVDSWAAWRPFDDLKVEDVTDATVATVLGLLGLVLWLAALAHLVVMITRAGALLVLAALTPAAAAGLVGEAGRAWFWKSLRWFHAAAFTPVLMALMLGLGVQLTDGVVTTEAGPAAAAGTALPGVVLILVACVSPLALFRLLAFVDPATPSGASARAAWAAVDLARRWTGTSSGSADSGGSEPTTERSAGESAAGDTTEQRLASAQSTLLGSTGPAGAGVAGGVDTVRAAGSGAAADGTAQTASMGVGAPGTTTPPPAESGAATSGPTGADPTGPDAAGPDPAATTPNPVAAVDPVGSSVPPPGSSAGPASTGSDSAGAGPGESAGSRAAAVAAEIPVVPV